MIDPKFVKTCDRLVAEEKMSITAVARMLNCQREIVIEALAQVIVKIYLEQNGVKP